MDRVASEDQVQAACRSLAGMCAVFKAELVDAGFRMSDAQRLVEVWMRTMMEKHDTRNV